MEVSLATPLVSRDGTLTKDAKLLNCYWETNSQGQRIVAARPGLQSYDQKPAGQGQGVFSGSAIDYCIVGDTIYGMLAWGGITPIPLTTPTSPGLRMSIVSAPNLSGPSVSFIKSTQDAWTFSSSGGGTVTRVTSTYPATTVPGVAYLDGTYYVMDPYGGIFGSSLEDPTTWTALNKIQVDRGLGKPVALGRHLNFVVAFCEKGLQFFYDAANPSPGSPLSPAQNATSSIGCLHGDSPRAVDDDTFFLSVDKFGAPSVSVVSGMNIQQVSTPDVGRVLASLAISTYDTQVYSMAVKFNGHSFYVLTIGTAVTLAYDTTTGTWAQWSTFDPYANADNPWDPGFCLRTRQSPGPSSAPTAFLGRTSGKTYSYGTGSSDEAVHMLIRTRPLDAGATSRKTLSELGLLGDTVNVIIYVRYSNDDCQTWSSLRTINMGLERKRLTRLGSFFRRVFEFSCTLFNQSLRVESMVLPDRNLPAQAAPSQE